MTVNGQNLGPAQTLTVPVAGTVTLHNPGQNAVPGGLVVQGVPIQAPPASRAGMEVHRHFFGLDGSALDPDHLAQNTTFVLVIDGRANDGQDHQAMVLAGLPAGWEIAGNFSGGTVAGLDWLGTLSNTQSVSAGDDRYAAVVALTADQPGFRVAVLLRAVTPGSFDYPGMTLSDMYRPAVFARQGGVRISVTPPSP
jgi:uncharacterized protein YfaS (alpha-2-macroglobulin family)